MTKKHIFLSTFYSLIWGVLGLFFLDTLLFFIIPILVLLYGIFGGKRHA